MLEYRNIEILVADSDIKEELDATGLQCPMPILKTRQALKRLVTGECVRVRATDPASVRDFAVFAQQTGNLLRQSEEKDGEFVFVICRNDERERA